jgi:putative flavoprotein involved in K+ transport
VIVGAGASGLSAAAALRRRDIDAEVLEQDAAIGGTWARRYDRLHLHTIRRLSGLAYYAIPRRYSRYLSRDQFVEYLQEYASAVGVRVVTDTTVTHIRRSDDGSGWTIDASTGSRRARVVVIATGQYRQPMMPAWEGRQIYRGRLLHSAAYSNAVPFAGQRVLVVGAGNSGAEIATDLAEQGARSVAMSVRTPPPVVPRDPFGMPVQRTSILLSAVPAAIANRFGRISARLTLGDLTRYGFPRAEFTPYTTRRIPIIDVGFVRALAKRLVTIRPAVERLTSDGAVFADGSSEPFDVIIAATGFSTGLGRMLDVPGLLDAQDEPIAGSGEPTSAPGLYFIGFVHSLRGHLFEANLTSRRLARNVEDYLADS